MRNIQKVIQDAYDNPERPFQSKCGVANDANLVGRCLKLNNRPRPVSVSGPKLGVFKINSDKVVLAGTNDHNTRVFLINGSGRPELLKRPGES